MGGINRISHFSLWYSGTFSPESAAELGLICMGIGTPNTCLLKQDVKLILGY